jgi:hypothetical protein
MRKFSFVLSAVAVVAIASIATAQSTHFMDIRDNVGAGQSITAAAAPFSVGQGDFPNDGGAPSAGTNSRGNGQVLRLNPTVSNGFHNRNAYPNFDLAEDGGVTGNKATGNLWLYVDVADDLSGVGDVLSSIGDDIIIQAPVAARYQIATTVFTWEPAGAITWSGTSNGAPAGAGGTLGVNDARAVKVPVSGSPAMYNTAGGLVPNPGGAPYRVAKLRVTAASRGTGCATNAAHATGSSYNLNNSVDSLLDTRVYNGAGDAQEDVSFGYTGGAPEATVNGNTVGAGAAGVRDAVIQVRMQGDTNGNGGVNSLDIPGFTTAQAAGTNLTQAQRYLFDNNNNGTVNSLDIPGFTAAQSAPCP